MRLRRKPKDADTPYAALRQQALEVTAESLGTEAAGAPVLALLMETGLLGGGRHALSPLFYAGHEVITEIRTLDEA